MNERADPWELFMQEQGPDESVEDALSRRSDESLLGLLASRDKGETHVREAVATELAYRIGILREVAQLQADRMIDLASRGAGERALADLEAASAAEILIESRALLNARRGEGNVAARLKVHLADLAHAVDRAQSHLRSLRSLGEELQTGSVAVATKIERKASREVRPLEHDA